MESNTLGADRGETERLTTLSINLVTGENDANTQTEDDRELKPEERMGE